MQFKPETFTWISPELSEDEQKKVAELLEQKMKGSVQHQLGIERQKAVDNFCELLGPEAVTRLDTEISKLQSMENPNRFRTAVYLLLIDAVQGGINMQPWLEEKKTDLMTLLQASREAPHSRRGQ